ncbi:MAG: ABC transporter substrate-binding protein [Bacteroidaceae bacterium]|nr:ABC transporter substrate-binding protein [Bacteroidaceae bacterium]
MKRPQSILLKALACLSLSACISPGTGFDRGCMEYASLLGMQDSCNVLEVAIANPWKEGSILQELALDRTFERVVVTSNNLAALMVELGVADHIAGVCEPEYIFDPTIHAMIDESLIADCGSGMYPNIEKILEISPDAIFVSPFEGNGYAQLEKLGIPLIQCADYMETSPLGRAEWIRFYGRLFGAENKADSLFNVIRDRYESLAGLTSDFHDNPKVMLDTRSGSAWYTAGGMSTIGTMLADAGADYAFADMSGSGSIPLAFESVYEKAQDSDIWFLKNSTSGNLTYGQLEKDFSGYSRFLPFQNRKIWVCDVYRTPYFEETAFHPELLLNDFIAIIHPESGLTANYYHPLD